MPGGLSISTGQELKKKFFEQPKVIFLSYFLHEAYNNIQYFPI